MWFHRGEESAGAGWLAVPEGALGRGRELCATRVPCGGCPQLSYQVAGALSAGQAAFFAAPRPRRTCPVRFPVSLSVALTCQGRGEDEVRTRSRDARW